VQICPQCGNEFDGDQCLGCIPPKAGVDKTLVWSSVTAFVGIILTSFALGPYRPLRWDSLVFSHDIDFIAIPVAIIGLLALLGRLERYIAFVRAIFVSASAATLIVAAFFFLNGALDEHPPVEVEALVSSKYITSGKFAHPALALSIEWNQSRIEEALSVSRETFSIVQPGDSVGVTIHPGAFSTPWFNEDVVLNATVRSHSTRDKR
jgi:hypothetical protein